MKKNIGWIGTGVMGRHMCMHLLNEGYNISVYNRTKSKASELVSAGARWCESPEETAQRSDIIFTIVGFPEDVAEVILGTRGVLSGCKEGNVLIDMTTSKPSLAEEIYNKAAETGVSSIDAPVSGGDTGAREAKLAIMAGGEKKTFDSVLPLLEILGKNISYMGKPGSGQHTKMCNQILIASTMIGVVESLIYGYKSGLNQDEIISVIGKGAAESWSINNLGPKIINGDFKPGFFIKHFIKDMGIALDEAKRMKLSLPGLALAHQFYMSAAAIDLENSGTQALYKVLGNINNIK
jgi:3-hydroxyisobutyrate dehydrogenase